VIPKQAANPHFGGPRTLSAFIPKLTNKAFEKHGFPVSALLMEWAEIAGPDLATFTRPEKLTWPRRPRNDLPEHEQTSYPSKQSGGATLILRVDGPRAIEVQHSATQIKEQINAYFGYNAVTELRFLQAPITNELPRNAAASKAVAPKSVAPNTAKPTKVVLSAPEEVQPGSKLEATLARLAKNLDLPE